MPRPRNCVLLKDVLGEDCLELVHKLREELIEVLLKEETQLKELAMWSGIKDAILSEFLRGTIYRTSKSGYPPDDKISLVTYKALRAYTDKRKKYLEM